MRCRNYTGLTKVRIQGQHEVLELSQADQGENARINMRCWNYTGLTKVRMQGQHEVLELHRADQGENARTT